MNLKSGVFLSNYSINVSLIVGLIINQGYPTSMRSMNRSKFKLTQRARAALLESISVTHFSCKRNFDPMPNSVRQKNCYEIRESSVYNLSIN